MHKETNGLWRISISEMAHNPLKLAFVRRLSEANFEKCIKKPSFFKRLKSRLKMPYRHGRVT